MPQRSLTIPLLPCRSLDESIPFYEALGFTRTYRQDRPYSAAGLVLDDINIHLFGIDGFVPEDSYGSAIILVSDPDQTYRALAAGLRDTYGKLPAAGIPRILRPRKRQGTTYGFTIVDPGGNWLRFFKLPSDQEPDEATTTTGLARVIENAARLGDSKGDEAAAIRLLTAGLDRHPDAPMLERIRALLYLSELGVRIGDPNLPRDALRAAGEIDLDPDQRATIAEELAHSTRLVEEAAETLEETDEAKGSSG